MPLESEVPADRPLVVENRKATRRSLRERNRRLVLQQILSAPGVSRAQVARSTGLTRASVSQIVTELLDHRLVRENGPGTATSSGGKPPTLLEVSADTHQMICVDASTDPIRAGLVNLAGDVVHHTHAPVSGLVGDDAARGIADLVDEVRAHATGDILAVAVGTPGVVQPDGVVLQAANLGWANRNLASELAGGIGEPVLVINDAQAAALGEYALGPTRSPSLATVLVGAGIGAGVVLNGRLYRGETSSAGEIGHLDVGGTHRCSCGQVGCLETVASLPSLLRTAEVQDPVQSADLAEALHHVPDEAWTAATRGLATALLALVAILDVTDIVLGGPITAAGPAYLEQVEQQLQGRVLPGRQRRPTVRFSELGEDNVLLGVGSYALHQRLGVGWTA